MTRRNKTLDIYDASRYGRRVPYAPDDKEPTMVTKSQDILAELTGRAVEAFSLWADAIR
jgi:hypothetical protein